MRRGRFSALAAALALLLVGTIGAASGGRGPVEQTSAAWTDTTHAAAAVTSGTWVVAPTNACTAYGNDGRVLTGCTVTSITFTGWGSPGNQIRNYYINLQTPAGARSVAFDVDLSTATGSGRTWSWKNARIPAGAQFTARDGWTCGELPRVRGTGADWQTIAIYFQVAEAGGASTVCR
ncbi:hypothetical protein [Microbacterium aerolatum]|uniref:CBM2 domain-containing protein n=1 Tax=Microbacterium aerolatum TaxID=153731 RepID=A0A511AJ84_9MICO|nr:hypothetical protein [Microbacterium aerolatum]GEK86841.1 hypothetical protein MAE01_20170 [Microbacterium aerolatum]GGB24686.1 hypothetical protein GCM10007198_13780 [Microbacterium aerolatum]